VPPQDDDHDCDLGWCARSVTRERFRAGNRRLADGVGARAFGHEDRYPILDYRALEALGVSKPAAYTVLFWNAYVGACRKIDDEIRMRHGVIDRALWQWSKERSQRR
jgi:hypothetical protein